MISLRRKKPDTYVGTKCFIIFAASADVTISLTVPEVIHFEPPSEYGFLKVFDTLN